MQSPMNEYSFISLGPAKMTRNGMLKAIFLALLCIQAISASGLTYYSRNNGGSWGTAATWSTDGVLQCAGAAAASAPGAADDVVICTGFTVIWNSAATTSINNLTILTGGVLTISVNGINIQLNSLQMDGTVNGNGSGDLRMGLTAGKTLSGTGFFSNTAGNCQLRLLSNVTVLAGTDLKWNNNNVLNLNGFTLTNNGKIQILNPASISNRASTFINAANAYLVYTRQASFPNTVVLNASASGNTVEYGAGGATTRTMASAAGSGNYFNLLFSGSAPQQMGTTTTNIAGNITINSGATVSANTGTRNINVKGNWVDNLGGSFLPQTSTVTFNATAANQTISSPAGGETFYDLTINNTNTNGTVTANGGIQITNARTLRITAGILDMQSNTLTQISGSGNFTATGGELRMAKLGVTLPELTGTYNITGGTITFNGTGAQTIRSLNVAPANYNNITLSGVGTKTLAGNIAVRGDWTNTGSTLAGAFTVSFTGTGTQTITNTAGENFNSVTVNTAGPLTFASTTDVTISNTLTMTTGSINLNGQTLQLGNGAGATLTRAAGICYGGVFKRYFPVAAISSTVAPLYGLFPVGSNINYRPVEINSTVNPTGAGYVSVTHNDFNTAPDVSYTDNEGAAIVRVTDMNDAITTSGLTGGTYSLRITFNGLSAAGLLTDLKMETLGGPPFGVGTSAANGGTVNAPVLNRTGLTLANLTNSFVCGTKDKSTTPLIAAYYSRRTGNWNDATVGNSTWSLTSGGPSCNCIPINSSLVYINATHTVSVVTTSATADFVNVLTGGTLNGTASLTVNFDLTTAGTAKVTPTGGTWTIGRNLTLAGTGASTSAAPIVVTGALSVGAGTSLTMSNTLQISGNLVVDGTLALGANTMTLNGSGTTISGSTGAATISGSGPISVQNAKTVSVGTNLTVQPIINLLAATTITSNGAITTTADITGTNAVTSSWVNGANSALTTTGAILSTGVLDASGSPNTVTYNNLGAQTVKAPSTSYFNLVLSNGGLKTAGGNTTITNLLTIQNSSIYNVGTNSVSGAGGLTMTGTSEIQIATASGTTYPELSGTYSLGVGTTVTMNQTASANYDMRGVDYYNLNLAGSGSVVNGSSYDFLSGASVQNNLTVSLGGTSRFRNTNAALTVVGDFSMNNTSTNTSILFNDLTVGSFTLTGGLFNASSFNLNIVNAGGWTQNGGTFTASTGSVNFNGLVDQTLNGSVTPTFNNLTINNTGPAGVTLNRGAIVTGNLTLTEGNFITSSANLITLNAGATTSGASSSSFVEGPMAKVGNTTFNFPVGKAGIYYRPIQLSAISASGNIQAEYFYADPNGVGFLTAQKDPTLHHVTKGEYWVVNSPAINATVTLSWDSNSGIVDDLPNLKVAGWNGTTWKDLGNGGTTGAVSPATGTISTSAVAPLATYGAYTLASANTNNPLPIGLSAFTAEYGFSGVEVRWTTETETNNDYFVVERTADAESFEKIVQVKGAGTSTVQRTYFILDLKPQAGVQYYRLKQVDFDGRMSYSKLVSVEIPNTSVWSVSPNPSSGNEFVVNFSVNDLGKPAYIKVQDVEGKEVFQLDAGVLSSSRIKIVPPQNLQPGLYVISIAVEQDVVRQKLIIR
ncbi:MAG TPA: T9SS type A sorting domain-containing protein [Cyclobacteriaceae bacterium]|nr:T9SS type A sorting domain-containing protein [Cyclobacteriaceae bacterium]